MQQQQRDQQGTRKETSAFRVLQLELGFMDAQKQVRENTQELHDFLKDLQDWERTVKNKDNQLKSQAKSQEKLIPPVRKARTPAAAPSTKPSENAAKHTYDYFRDKWDKFDLDTALKEVDEEPKKPAERKLSDDAKLKEDIPIGTPQTFASEAVRLRSDSDSVPDATSEKDLGNEFFKEKKYVQAIECYSRSIGLHPTAIAFANRAMALLKIRRYEDAEADCTEAISLDDRYTKAYARRGTARKERNKLLGAVEDFEFALRLEPHNKELEKQYEEAKALYEKKNSFRPAQKIVSLDVQRPPSGKAEPLSEKMKDEKKTRSVQEAAARAAVTAMTAVSQNMVAPKTSYEFETLWRGFADDCEAKVRLIKLMDPSTFPKVFRESLSASLMMDILKTLEPVSEADPKLAIQVADSLTRVGRFSMTVMCLSQKEKNDIQKLLDKLFISDPGENLKSLKVKYRV